jgi:multidrug efflux pump
MGAGANARHSIGTGIIGGMIGETTLAMLYVPLFFYLFDQLTEKLEERKKAKAQAKEVEGEKDPPADGHAHTKGEGG